METSNCSDDYYCIMPPFKIDFIVWKPRIAMTLKKIILRFKIDFIVWKLNGYASVGFTHLIV